MRVEKREYGYGTFLLQAAPYGFYAGGRAMCSDGRVRALARIADSADTFFSVPAAVKVKGKTVTGYVTVEAASGSNVDTDNDPAVVKFIANAYGRNGDYLPGLAWRADA